MIFSKLNIIIKSPTNSTEISISKRIIIMYFEKVNKFYQTLVNSEHFNEKLKNKLQRMHDEKEYKVFIKDELIPLAKAMGYNLSVDDILSYEHQKLQQLSKEEL